jgi:adenosylmethionine-8-amino-7-oxononanoate aminotransferase
MASQARTGATLPRSFRKTYPVAVRGEGGYLYDAEGKRYLDLAGSAAVNFIGHGVPEVAQAMAEQACRLEFAHTSQFTTDMAEEFAREVLDFAGMPGGRVFFVSGGSEAVESALKLARQYQVEIGRKEPTQIVSRDQAYHGATLGALAVSGNKRRREIYLPMVRDSQKVSTPYCYRCKYGCQDCAQRYADELDSLLKKIGKSTAAFIFEPISGATLGAAVPPDGYIHRIAEICEQHGVLTIADEVMTGFGRTGRNFAVEHWGVQPDIIVCAKGIASGYAPLGAVIASKKVVDAIASGSGALVHGLTYNAHPVATAAGHAVLKMIRGDKLVAAAASSGIAKKLENLRMLRSVGDVRGRGLLWGVEFILDKATKKPYPTPVAFAEKVAAAAMQRGLLVYPMRGCIDGDAGDHVLLAPPATLSDEQIAWGIDQLIGSIEEVESQER